MLNELEGALDGLQELTDQILADLVKTIPESADEIYNEVYDFASQLKRNSNGTFAQTTENLKAIDKFRPKLDAIIENTNYNNAVYDFTAKYKELQTGMNEYFTLMSVTVPQDALYKEVTDIAINNSVNSLLGDGLSANFNEGIMSIMKDGITAGSDRNALKKQLSDYIIGSGESQGKLMRYADQISGDLVHQYQSNYFSAISQDLDIKYYLYKGTKIRDSRPFCKAIAGKVFTQDELKTIVTTKSAGNGWDGMIPGTNWSNFAQNRGGYRCRHTLVPITKAVYNMLKVL